MPPPGRPPARPAPPPPPPPGPPGPARLRSLQLPLPPLPKAPPPPPDSCSHSAPGGLGGHCSWGGPGPSGVRSWPGPDSAARAEGGRFRAARGSVPFGQRTFGVAVSSPFPEAAE
ncbi:ragulator complex protein LAMTOR2 isoform X3 [Rattus norvegicus]